MVVRIATIFPSWTYANRSELFICIYKDAFPGYVPVMLLNVLVVAISCLLAVFYDKVKHNGKR